MKMNQKIQNSAGKKKKKTNIEKMQKDKIKMYSRFKNVKLRKKETFPKNYALNREFLLFSNHFKKSRPTVITKKDKEADWNSQILTKTNQLYSWENELIWKSRKSDRR